MPEITLVGLFNGELRVPSRLRKLSMACDIPDAKTLAHKMTRDDVGKLQKLVGEYEAFLLPEMHTRMRPDSTMDGIREEIREYLLMIESRPFSG